MAARACPVCRIPLENLAESSSAQCPSCHGLWVPPDALPAAASGLFKPLIAGFRELDQSESLHCPDCGSATLEAVGRSGYQLRRCTNCNGVWVDETTLGKLRREISPRWRGFLTTALGKGLGAVFGKSAGLAESAE
jgi:Zn-finger nucleic acid-binding protein